MNILIISQYALSSYNKNFETDRFKYIANLLSKNKENQVELVTTTFSHEIKQQKDIISEYKDNVNYKITQIYEPGYKKNVDLKRIYSHHILAKNIKKYLLNLDYNPDIIYCAVPSLSVANIATKYAKKNNIRFIIDIQDLWPEAFKMVFSIPFISNIFFYPMKKRADYIYKNADDLIAVSNTYLERALQVKKNYRNILSVFLGTELKHFDEFKEENKNKDSYFKLAYVGTLGHSYDIKCIIDSIKILNDKGLNNIKFIIMGSGPLKNKFEEYAKEKNVNCEFTGRLDYDKMVKKLCSCNIAINPISKGAAQSIINKVGDYAMAGLPVISTQECKEYRNLVEKYNIGFNCENNNAKDVANKIEILYNNESLRVTMGKNNRKLAEEKFDREVTYNKILNIIFPKKVSVIVPIYNTEKYLDRCITSIINQNYKNLEIILINDGSTDSSIDICNKYKNLDNRIIVINKKNEGQSYARNTGLEIATGDYISFIDSDDYINCNMISTLVKNIELYNSDVSVCSLKLIKNNNEIKQHKSSKIKLIKPNESDYMTAKDGYGASVCNKLYKKDIIGQIRFEKNNINEDGRFNNNVNKVAKLIVFENVIYYYYYLRENSTIHGLFKDVEFMNLIDYLEDLNHITDTSIRNYKESRSVIKATKIMIGIISSDADKDNKMLFTCFDTIKKYYKIMLVNKNISLSKKFFVTFCLIMKKKLIKRNKILVKLCKKMRKIIG